MAGSKMAEKLIQVSDLEVDKPDTTRSPFKIAQVKELAKSIEFDGLLFPPIVRPIDNGKYKVVDGRKRMYACVKILGWTEVTCRVATDMDDDMAIAAENAANIFRAQLSDSQIMKSMAQWHAVYAERHPLAQAESGVAQKLKGEVQARVKEAEANGETITEEKVAEIKEEVKEEAKPFYKTVMDTLGVPVATAKRMARIAKHIPEESFDILAAAKCSKDTHTKIAALEDPKKVETAIRLIAAGGDHDEAIRVAAGSKGAIKKGSPTKEKDETKPKASDKLTDDEWLLQHCSKILELLTRKAPFKRDAKLYRRLVEAMANFRKSARKPLVEAEGDYPGQWYSVIFKAVHTSHPAHWLVCGKCDGKGYTVDSDKRPQCPKCFGAAYLIKMEN